MRVIFIAILTGRGLFLVEMEARMPLTGELTRSRDAAGNVVARLGLPLAE
jgi:hypothetical protein